MNYPLIGIVFSGLVLGIPWNCRDVLGVNENASEEELKSAYRREALIWHPDRNPNNPEANDRFISINNCYEELKKTRTETANHAPQTGGFTFSFNVGRMYGTSTSSSTSIHNGKKITRIIKKDLATGATQTTVTEEDLSTGIKRVIEDLTEL
jgi:DnaJ-class molecular chaperone